MAKQESTGAPVTVQGRIVWGSVKGRQKINSRTRQPEVDPATGQPVIQWAFGLAVPKPSPQSSPDEVKNFQDLWTALQSQMLSLYPQGAPRNFAWKYVDGDGPDKDNIPFANREGYRGCLVVACSTYIPLKLFSWENGQNVQVTDERIKCGYYVDVALNIKAHGPANGGDAGLYINPSFVRLIGYGPEIIAGPSVDMVFSGAPAFMLPGASQTPIGMGGAAPMPAGFNNPQQPPGMPQTSHFPTHQAAPMAQPGYGQQPAPQGYNQAPTGGGQQPQAAQPYHNVLPQQFQPAPGAVPGYGGGAQQPMGTPNGAQMAQVPGGYPQAQAPQGMQMPGMQQAPQQPGAMPGMMPYPGYQGQ